MTAADNEFLTYEASGVDTSRNDDAVDVFKRAAKLTMSPHVVGGIGHFAGGFSLKAFKGMEDPVLVSSTDGVGTKVMIAIKHGRSERIGIDLVGMVINDLLCLGARPLFMLDYIGIHKIEKELVAQIAEGLAEGCRQAECALVGGETAEMNDLYSPGEYDLVGFGVGVIDKHKIIDGSAIRSGDKLVALASSGIHSNGFSLVRKIIDTRFGGDYEADVPELEGGLLETILEPTKIYVKPVLAALEKFAINGIVHNTGGGIPENLPRVLPKGLAPRVDWSAIEDTPPIFDLLQQWGPVETKEMQKTFNMGVGMILVIRPELAEEAVSFFKSIGEKSFVIGDIVEG